MVSSPTSGEGWLAPIRQPRGRRADAARRGLAPVWRRGHGCGATWTADDYIDVLVWALPALILAAPAVVVVAIG